MATPLVFGSVSLAFLSVLTMFIVSMPVSAAVMDGKKDQAGAVVEYMGEDVFSLHASALGQSASQRAKVVNAVLERLDLDEYQPEDLAVAHKMSYSEILIKDHILLTVGSDDAGAEQIEVRELADQWRMKLARAIFGIRAVLPSDPYEFVETAARNEIPVIISFYSTNCSWCRRIRTEFAVLLEDYGDRVGLLYVDINDQNNDELVFAFDAFSVPWNVFLKRDGSFMGVFPGYGTRLELERMLKALLAADDSTSPGQK